jgi:uncharacterized membrane protein YeaQ/YmgE (transglycosylase-associated protein family)
MNRFVPLALILLLVIVFRCVGSAFSEQFPNFQPLSALFFCGAILARNWRGWAIPCLAWLVTYPVPALLTGDGSYLAPEVILVTAFGFAAVYFLGKAMAPKHITTTLAGAVVAALVFHLITNLAAWIGSPLYPKTPAGIVQSLWTGPVGSPLPSWVFLQNMIAANLIFTSVFLYARFVLPKISTVSNPAEVR